ncbi:MAG: hypothetical protein IPM66_14805 [Acidobacteriota bacterium]|nr:MAG: hypothetical protein IPM66_14805 [Acidobacteriota bacterium]
MNDFKGLSSFRICAPLSELSDSTDVVKGAFSKPRIALDVGYLKVVAQESAKERTYKSKYWTPGLLEIVRVDNLQFDSFPGGFGIEVKNISKKPVYNIWVEVLLPDARQYLGGLTGSFPVKFGSPRLHSAGSVAEPSDERLDPGESVVLRPHASVINNFFTLSDNRDQIRQNGTGESYSISRRPISAMGQDIKRGKDIQRSKLV